MSFITFEAVLKHRAGKHPQFLRIIFICRIMLFTVNPILSNNSRHERFLSNSSMLIASICAVGNPLLSPQDASSFLYLTLSHSVHPITRSLHGPIYQGFFFPFSFGRSAPFSSFYPISDCSNSVSRHAQSTLIYVHSNF